MTNTIKTIVFATILQVGILASLIVFLTFHTDDIAKQYANMAEQNATAHTEMMLTHYNTDIQNQMNAEREDMHAYIDRRIDVKLIQALQQK